MMPSAASGASTEILNRSRSSMEEMNFFSRSLAGRSESETARMACRAEKAESVGRRSVLVTRRKLSIYAWLTL